jgi:hypothetical protein
LAFLGLKQFAECPEYDLEPCYWRFCNFVDTGDAFSGPAESRKWFDSHADKFESRCGATDRWKFSRVRMLVVPAEALGRMDRRKPEPVRHQVKTIYLPPQLPRSRVIS